MSQRQPGAQMLATRRINAERKRWEALTPAQRRAENKARRSADAELDAMVDGYVPAFAPVSPAVV